MNAEEALALLDNWPSDEEAACSTTSSGLSDDAGDMLSSSEEEILDLGLNRDAESLSPCASDDIVDRLSAGEIYGEHADGDGDEDKT